MKIIITESQKKRLLEVEQINEQRILGQFFKFLANDGIKFIKNLFKSGPALKKAETEIVKAAEKYGPNAQESLRKLAPKLKGVMKELELYRGNFIKKYGQHEYDSLIIQYLYDNIDKKTFLNKLKNIKSPNIRVKPVLGAGSYHKVYQSSIHPDKVFKVERAPGEVDKWFNLFNQNQKTFAKTFQKIKIKDVDGKILTAVVMEKLNTTPFMQLWDDMEKTLGKFKTLNPNLQVENLEKFSKRLYDPQSFKKWNEFIKFTKQKNPSLSNKIDEFNKIVNQLYKITPHPDIRKFNLGYDKSGILKALDI
jgi:hypothetical protein